jgi:hypothetical protein
MRNKENLEPAPEASPSDEDEPYRPGLGKLIYALILLVVISYVFPAPTGKFLLFLVKFLAFIR